MWTFESIKRNSIVKWVAAAFLALLLNALGNPFWDSVLNPLIHWASYGLMSVSSLGMKSVRTDIYEGIATGSTSAASLQTMWLLTMFGAAAYLGMFQVMFYAVRKERRELARTEQRIAERGKGNKTPPETQTAEQILTAWRGEIKTGRRLLYIFGLLILLILGMFVVDLSRISFETAAVVHYQQALKIAAPYLTETDRAMVESKFAQIHSKAEYIAILDGLAKTANEHGQQVPPFSAW